MNKNLLIYIVLLGFIFFSSRVLAGLNQDDLFSELSKKYSKTNSLEFKFKMKEMALISGSIKAKKGNKFIIKTSEREIYCNGKINWTYIHQNKKVIISDYEDNSKSLSLENLFFSMMKYFKPASLKKVSDSKTGSGYNLELVPSEQSYEFEGINKLKLTLTSDKLIIKEVIIERSNDRQTFEIRDLKLDTKLSDGEFEFVAPKDIEVIDMR